MLALRKSGLRRPELSSIFVALLIFASIGFAGAWPWNRDMLDQANIKPQEQDRPAPANTLPADGLRLPLTRDEAGAKLESPVAMTPESAEKGRHLYDIYCALCHGVKGRGDGPIARKYVPPPDLTLDFFLKRTDGFIYGTILYGGPIMPSYKDSLSDVETWHIVNYVRKLQGK